MAKKHRLSSIALFTIAALAAASFAATGCNSSSNNDPRKSKKGEVCETTSDCADQLSCVPRATAGGGGVCVQGEFKVAPTAKECAVIQCQQPVDCCPTPPPSCVSYDQQCKQGSMTACDEYNRYCKCDGAKFACNNGACSAQCQTNTDCFGGTCSNGACIQCQDDSGCTNGNVCSSSGQCVPPCQTDTDCPSFNRCDTGKCVDSGCASDRECIAATKNVTATCAKDKTCVVPCDTDLECGNPEEYKFYSCIKSQCVYVGCASDKECQLYLQGQSGQTGTTHGQIVCRDKATQ